MFEFEKPRKHGCVPIGKCTCGKGPWCPTCGYCDNCGGAKGMAELEKTKTYCRKCGSLLPKRVGKGRPKVYCDDCKAIKPGDANV